MRDICLNLLEGLRGDRRHRNQPEVRSGHGVGVHARDVLCSKLFTVRGKIREMESFEEFLDLYKTKLSNGDTTCTIAV